MHCPLCNSEHAPAAYTRGWYVDENGKTVEVKGHKETSEAGKTRQMFWSLEALQAQQAVEATLT